MLYKLMINLVILLHFSFILFVISGGWLVLKWKHLIWVHIPASIWGVVVEYFNILCPLTPLENYFRQLSGETVYNTGFINHYLSRIIYPEELDRTLQFFYGSLVIIINIAAYTIYIRKARKYRVSQKQDE